MQRDALQAEQETNLRLESYNQQLTARNAELKRAQEVAVDALQGAERASKAKTDFLSNMRPRYPHTDECHHRLHLFGGHPY